MAERQKVKIPKKYTDAYGKYIKLWSYSRISTFHNCPYEYYLGRIMRIKGEDNIYSILGTCGHQILQDCYEGNAKFEDMPKIFDENFLEVETSNYKFTSNEEDNTRMRNKYKDCVRFFLEHHQIMSDKVLIERCIWVDIKGNIFIGYIDAIHKEGDDIIITDFKTSSISGYKGKKLEEKQKQLLLYALGINQLGTPLEKIKVRWLFLKYQNIRYTHKINVTYLKGEKVTTSLLDKDSWVNGVKTQLKKDLASFYTDKSTKEIKIILEDCINSNSLVSVDSSIHELYTLWDCVKIGEGNKWVDAIKTQLKKDIVSFYECEEWEADIKISECIESNSLSTLDKSVQDLFMLEDCYVYGEVTQDTINDLIDGMADDIKTITSFGKEEKSWEIECISKDMEFYCNKLCGLKAHCKYYTEYIKTLNTQEIEDDELMKELEGLM